MPSCCAAAAGQPPLGSATLARAGRQAHMERLGAITASVVQSETAAGPAAERLLVNGRIYQAGGAPHASWLRIVGGTIAELGDGTPPPPRDAGDKVQVVDLKGRFVLPGLHDAHIHTYSVGEASFFVNLGGCRSIGELKQRLKSHAEANPASSWIIGVQWAQHEMGGTYPCAAGECAAHHVLPPISWCSWLTPRAAAAGLPG